LVQAVVKIISDERSEEEISEQSEETKKVLRNERSE
jgi:hypothetical protein